jgi:hypothetical protein
MATATVEPKGTLQLDQAGLPIDGSGLDEIDRWMADERRKNESRGFPPGRNDRKRPVLLSITHKSRNHCFDSGCGGRLR